MKKKNIMRSAVGSLIALVGTVMMFDPASAQTAISIPLSASCFGYASGGVIAWSADPAGGSPPYSYHWSGEGIDRDIANPVIATYAATGTYAATLSVHDSASEMATSTCFAAVISPPPHLSGMSIVPTARLSILQTVDSLAPSPGTVIDYHLAVSASGPATSTGVMVSDILPTGVSFIGAHASVGDYSSSTGLWDIGDMLPHTTAILDIQALVISGTARQIITNAATVGESSTVMNPVMETASAVAITVASEKGYQGLVWGRMGPLIIDADIIRDDSLLSPLIFRLPSDGYDPMSTSLSSVPSFV